MAKLTTRSEDYSKWYNELVVKADLAENSGVRGSMVIKPYGYAIWEKIQAELDKKFKEIGHKTEDRRNLSPNTSHVVPLDQKGKGHHDQDHKDKGWYDPVKAPFQECQVVDSLLARKFIDQERCNQKS